MAFVGRCGACGKGHRFSDEDAEERNDAPMLFKPLELVVAQVRCRACNGRLAVMRVTSTSTGTTCDASCCESTSPQCDCACNGNMHGSAHWR